MKSISPIVLIFLGLAAVSAAPPKDYTVQVEAEALESPVAIRLFWPPEPDASQYQVSRKLRSEVSWTVMVDLPGSASEWTDTSVSAGVHYEYRVWRPAIHGAYLAGFGYLSAGVRVAPVDRRGTVLLIVDDSMAGPLTLELERLRQDLIGDGWTVVRHDVSRQASVPSVKALIQADYAADPAQVRSVFLFGHVPVPYSGNVAYDGHPPEHHGAWVADLYYGDMDGIWTDSTVDNAGSHFFPETDNIPGDGKFDQSLIPSAVELEVGRVDLSNMPAFAKSETELLRQYLDKDHAHRHALRVLPRRALIDDRLGEFYGQAFAVSGWRAGTAFGGSGNITEGQFGILATQAYLFHYMGGGGWIDSCDSVHTSDFASSDPQAAFTLYFGSWFGDWDKQNSFLRAALATTTGLTCGWAGRPHWFLHPMALGSTIGECARLTQNNRTEEPTYIPLLVAGYAHVSLMGDPTLRLFAVAPPSTVSLTQDANGHAAVGWGVSPAATLGYHIYRASNPAGPFLRLTADPVSGTSWTDTTASNGAFTYQVKAVKLESAPGGTYTNTSQAASASINLTGGTGVTYASWITDAGLTGADALPAADPDKNGLSNLIEYGLGIAHGSADLSGLPDVTVAGGEMTLTYQALRADLTYQPEWSVNLESWFTVGITLTTLNGVTTAHVPVGTEGRKFFRLKIAQ